MRTRERLTAAQGRLVESLLEEADESSLADRVLTSDEAISAGVLCRMGLVTVSPGGLQVLSVDVTACAAALAEAAGGDRRSFRPKAHVPAAGHPLIRGKLRFRESGVRV